MEAETEENPPNVMIISKLFFKDPEFSLQRLKVENRRLNWQGSLPIEHSEKNLFTYLSK